MNRGIRTDNSERLLNVYFFVTGGEYNTGLEQTGRESLIQKTAKHLVSVSSCLSDGQEEIFTFFLFYAFFLFYVLSYFLS